MCLSLRSNHKMIEEYNLMIVEAYLEAVTSETIGRYNLILDFIK
jgi:hypothetical protein